MTRQRILDEATRQLLSGGYAAFTVAGVRDALGLSSGSMFHAFPSKAALAAAVYVSGMAAYQASALAVLEGALAAERAVRALVDNHLAWIEEHRDLAQLLFADLPDEMLAEVAAPLADDNARFEAALGLFFERVAASGLMARLPRALAHAITIGPAHEYGRRWVRGGGMASPRTVSVTMQNAALAALGATVEPAPRRRRRPTGPKERPRKTKEKGR